MIYQYPKYKNPPNQALGIVGGMVIGALVGAVAMLFLAPHSGKETRRQIQNKGLELRERTTEIVEDTVAHLRSNPQQITMGAQR